MERERLLVLRLTLHDRLDVDDRGAVYGFERVNFDPVIIYAENFRTMKADGVRAVGGASGEYPLKSIARVVARVRFQNCPVGLMEPGENPDVGSRFEAIESFDIRGIDFQTSTWSAFAGLTRGGDASGER